MNCKLESGNHHYTLHILKIGFTLSPPSRPLYIHYFLIVFKDLRGKGENIEIPVRGGGCKYLLTCQAASPSSISLYISKLLIYIEFYRIETKGIARVLRSEHESSGKLRTITCKTL